ncbi:MAG: pyridoxamine kinase [Clostridia bacterium]|nr:pyridoxamine kinase [Clostridia bacterium]
MSYKRILTIQDISCVGQCSLTVALPIISACGIEAAILPSAVLSTHTGGFSGYTFRDLTEDMPAIAEHWKKEGITFDAVYTGYLGSTKQIDYVLDIINSADCMAIIDPAMADHGKLYAGFDGEFVNAMKKLCARADIILPNLTEACLITDTEYRESYDKAYISELLTKLKSLTGGTVILTGVSYSADTTGVLVADKDGENYYEHRKISTSCHGTGDVYASAFTGAVMQGKTTFEAACIAADFTVSCIEKTIEDKSHWYGVKFELALPELIEKLS